MMRTFLWIVGLLIVVLLLSFAPNFDTQPTSSHLLRTFIYALWIVGQALQGVILIPLINIPQWGLLSIAIFKTIKSGVYLPPRFYGYVSSAVLFPIIISLIGAIFYDTDSMTAQGTVLGILGLNLLILGYLTYRERGFRLLVFSAGGIMFVWSFFTAFVAGMAIVNDWI